ncbi:hypothetical protein SAMN02745163_00554 [Clostridium cavendishii DSM 21758]|uniref:Repeat domain-containing protein n=1 Tax=Clostridium cavendishii DSM 21758 TaxID=1121302 RepID=A0A1M6CUP2_9CLOT|nr:hypothetical protein [Clostridium cavendishii]SHI64561.1 hypothetical protein SAMN02745163_00554 [Clostridium cavendishii DSM 21758]
MKKRLRTYNQEPRKVLDFKYGDITGDGVVDGVYLMGNKPYGMDNPFEADIKLLVIDRNTGNEESIELKDESGYGFSLLLGNFTSKDKVDILVRGSTGGSGGYTYNHIFSYIDGKFKEIFNGEKFYSEYNTKANYIDDYKIYIISQKANKKYTIDIKDTDKTYLDMVYDEKGKVKRGYEIGISAINAAYPIVSEQDYLDALYILQRIIGQSNSNDLGVVQTLIRWEDGKFKLVNQTIGVSGSELKGNRKSKERIKRNVKLRQEDNKTEQTYKKYIKEIVKAIPEVESIIFINNGIKEVPITFGDLDNDGEEEIVIAYKYEGEAYVAIIKQAKEGLIVLDKIKGSGSYVRDIIIAPVIGYGMRELIIGWQIGGVWQRLDIRKWNGECFQKILFEDIDYSKIDVIDLNADGKSEIALWYHDNGEVYRIEVYNLNNNMLYIDKDVYPEYFKRIIFYYKSLTKKNPDSAMLWYQLTKAQVEAKMYNEAKESIEKSLNIKSDYPSKEELLSLKEKIQNKLTTKV